MRLIWDKISGTETDETSNDDTAIEFDSTSVVNDSQWCDNENTIIDSSNDLFASDKDEVESSENCLGGFNDWGANRLVEDNINKCRGFPWTANELKIVRQWKLQNPGGSIKYCLEAIYSNEDFRKEFHIHHAINTARLLTAWKKF